MILDQFFGQVFRVSLALCVGCFLLAWIFFSYHSGLLLTGIVIVLFLLTYKNPYIGIRAVFLELFLSAHGHLLSVDVFSISFSLRMAVFVGFFLGYGLFLLRNHSWPKLRWPQFAIFLPLFLAIFVGLLNGFLFQNPLTVFQDGNAYFFLLYTIPILSLAWDSKQQNALLQVFAAGVIWNILLAFGSLYFFTHFSGEPLSAAYTFLRDTRLAEITQLNGAFFRVFMQTQFFVIAFGGFALALLLSVPARLDRFILSILAGFVLTIVLLSFSRSFWLAISCSAIVFLTGLFLIHGRRFPWKTLLSWSFFSSVVTIMSLLLLIFFPIPSARVGSEDVANAFKKRTSETQDVAISSRWKLFQPMWETILEKPIAGNGFGKAVTFLSDDPRVRALSPNGMWSTTAMEWGWLELWLKMGILGPIGFMIIFLYLIREFFAYKNTDHAWIGLGFVSALVFLSLTHFFSPYLNHPIGLGFILFAFLFLPQTRQEPVQVFDHIRIKTPLLSKPISPLAESRRSR